MDGVGRSKVSGNGWDGDCRDRISRIRAHDDTGVKGE